MSDRYEWGVASRDPLSGLFSGITAEHDWDESDVLAIADLTPFAQVVRRPVGKWEAHG